MLNKMGTKKTTWLPPGPASKELIVLSLAATGQRAEASHEGDTL